MLSCKTNSAKLIRRGGPVSKTSISEEKRGGRQTDSAAKVSAPTIRIALGAAVTVLTTTARISLQHGILGAGFFFAGAECIGQPLIGASDSVGVATVPRAQ